MLFMCYIVFMVFRRLYGSCVNYVFYVNYVIYVLCDLWFLLHLLGVTKVLHLALSETLAMTGL